MQRGCAFEYITPHVQPRIDNTIGRRLSFGNKTGSISRPCIVNSGENERAIHTAPAGFGSYSIQRILPPPLSVKFHHRLDRDIACSGSRKFRSQYRRASIVLPLCDIQKPLAKNLLSAILRNHWFQKEAVLDHRRIAIRNMGNVGKRSFIFLPHRARDKSIPKIPLISISFKRLPPENPLEFLALCAQRNEQIDGVKPFAFIRAHHKKILVGYAGIEQPNLFFASECRRFLQYVFKRVDSASIHCIAEGIRIKDSSRRKTEDARIPFQFRQQTNRIYTFSISMKKNEWVHRAP